MPLRHQRRGGVCDGWRLSGAAGTTTSRPEVRVPIHRITNRTLCSALISAPTPKANHPLRKGIIERNMVSSRTPTAIMMALSLIDVQHSSAFAPAPSHSQRTVHCDRHRCRGGAASVPTALCLSSSDIQAKLRAQMAKLQERDRSSREISPDVSCGTSNPGCCLDCDIALSAPHRRSSADQSLPARSSFFAHRDLLIVHRNWMSYMKTNTSPS